MKAPSPYSSKDGLLDLTSWDMGKNIMLDGEWEFYPQLLINSGEEAEELGNRKQIVHVPGAWDSYISEKESKDGFGTYRLRIKVPQDQSYGIKTRTIRMSSKVFINNQELFKVGNPSRDAESFIPGSRYKLAFSNSVDGELDLIVQVSSYGYFTGGIIRSIEFGTSQAILARDRIDRFLDGWIISICIVIGIYIFLVFLGTKERKYILYFSLIAFFLGLYLSLMKEQLLSTLIDYNTNQRLAIQGGAISIITLGLLRFIYHFFNEGKKDIINKIITIMLIISFFLFASGASYSISRRFTGTVEPFTSLTLVASYSYIIYILVKSIKGNLDKSGLVNIIGMSLTSYWFGIIFKVILELDLGYFPEIMIFIMMTGTIFLIRDRQNEDYEKAKSLTKSLIVYDRIKDEFLSKISQEIGKPMGTIWDISNSLIEGQFGSLNEKQQENLLFINSESSKLGRIVEDFLGASNFHIGGNQLYYQEIRAYETIDSLLKEMTLLVDRNKNISLTNKIPKDIVLLADTDKFTHIIYNLVHNSIKFSEKGEIEVSAYEDGDKIIFTVKDEGRGIKKENLKNVFEMLYKESEGSQESEGFGIGLSIAMHLVELHEGEISLESIYGKGTEVSFSLPLYKRGKENIYNEALLRSENEEDQDREMVSGQGKYDFNIILSDQDEINRGIIEEAIRELGFSSIHVNSGRELLDLLQKRKVDLVILDLFMPDIPTDEICKQIRANFSALEVPILFLSSSARGLDLILDCEQGLNNLIRKPTDKKEIKARINSLAQMKKSLEESLRKEFQYFYSQISPHFLYNTINTIIGLSYKDTEKLRKALNNLSVYLRGKLDYYDEGSLTHIESELDLIKAYLEIEKMRFGEKLTIEYDIEENIDFLLPPLTLQPLVENAIQHGIMKKSDGGKVKISIKEEANHFHILIEDDGVGMSKEKQEEILGEVSRKIGFKNIVEKIKILKGASLELDSELGQGTRVIIKIKKVIN